MSNNFWSWDWLRLDCKNVPHKRFVYTLSTPYSQTSSLARSSLCTWWSSWSCRAQVSPQGRHPQAFWTCPMDIATAFDLLNREPRNQNHLCLLSRKRQMRSVFGIEIYSNKTAYCIHQTKIVSAENSNRVDWIKPFNKDRNKLPNCSTLHVVVVKKQKNRPHRSWDVHLEHYEGEEEAAKDGPESGATKDP